MSLCRTCPALDWQSVCEQPVRTQKLYTCRATQTWARAVKPYVRNPTSSRSHLLRRNCCAAYVKYSIATQRKSSSHPGAGAAVQDDIRATVTASSGNLRTT